MHGRNALRVQLDDARMEARDQVEADLRYMRAYQRHRDKGENKCEARRLALIECGMLASPGAKRTPVETSHA